MQAVVTTAQNFLNMSHARQAGARVPRRFCLHLGKTELTGHGQSSNAK